MKTPILILSLAVLLHSSAQNTIDESPVQLEVGSTLTFQGLDEVRRFATVSKQEIDDVVWALKAAMRYFAPEQNPGEWNFGNLTANLIYPEDRSSAEYFRRQAKEMEEKAKDAERKEQEMKRAYSILAKWEAAQKEMTK